MEVRFWASTDVGRKRGHNEDNYLVDRSLRLFVVCDGMGGHAAGEVASAATIQTIQSTISEGASDVTSGSGLHRSPNDEEAVLSLLEKAVLRASNRVWKMAQEDESKHGMGTTCSLLMFVGSRGYIAHVGDSRIYRLRDGSVTQITEDHSLRNHLIREGKLGEDEELKRENAVTRAVGVSESIEVETFPLGLQPGDRFVLCSDGLTEYLDDGDELFELASAEDLEESTRACIDHANRSGGKDNVTTIVVEVAEGRGVWDARQSTSVGRALRVLPHFEHLTPEEFGRVEQEVSLHRVDAGDILVSETSVPEGLFLIVEGEVELSEDGDIVDLLGAGDFFGERALLSAASPGMVGEAVEATTFALLTLEGFENILSSDDRLAAKITWNFLQRVTGKLQHFSAGEYRNPDLALSPDRKTRRMTAADRDEVLGDEEADGADGDDEEILDLNDRLDESTSDAGEEPVTDELEEKTPRSGVVSGESVTESSDENETPSGRAGERRPSPPADDGNANRDTVKLNFDDESTEPE